MTKAVLAGATALEIPREVPAAVFGHCLLQWCLVTPPNSCWLNWSHPPEGEDERPGWLCTPSAAGRCSESEPRELQSSALCHPVRWEGGGVQKTPIPKTSNRAREKEKTPPKKRGLEVLLCTHTFMCLIL